MSFVVLLGVFHFDKVASVPTNWIPIFYAVAMGVDALAAVLFGRFFDRFGLSVLLLVALVPACFAPLVFASGPLLIAFSVLIQLASLPVLRRLTRERPA